jgi:hypothetical protein
VLLLLYGGCVAIDSVDAIEDDDALDDMPIPSPSYIPAKLSLFLE